MPSQLEEAEKKKSLPEKYRIRKQTTQKEVIGCPQQSHWLFFPSENCLFLAVAVKKAENLGSREQKVGQRNVLHPL